MQAARLFGGALFTGAFGFAAPALAWGPEGHTVIARVATTGLSAQAAADLKWIISVGVPALNAEIKKKYGMNCQIDVSDPWGPVPDFTTDKDQHTNLANWADCYRYSDASTKDWHFDDIPLGDNPTGPLNASKQSWCKQPDSCAAVALADNLHQLATAGQSPADAARALAFVVHFVGDMHQPLHEETNGDTGGNDVSVVTRGSGVSAKELHALWDTPLVEAAMGDKLDGATEALAKQTASQSTPDFKTVDDVISASDGWIEDAHHLAQPAYALLSIPVGVGTKSDVPVSKAYVEKEAPVVASQLGLATVRLRAVLNAALTWLPPA